MKLAATLNRDYTKKPHFARQKSGRPAQIPGTIRYRQVPDSDEVIASAEAGA
jgi:hypothetical protein